MDSLKSCVDTYLSSGNVNNIAIRIGKNNCIYTDIFESANGSINQNTLFDIASVTKIVVTTTLCHMAFDKRILSPQDRVSKFFNVPQDKSEMSVFHLLTHTMGIGYKNLTQSTTTPKNIENHILNIPSDFPIGSLTQYSCPGYILLGRILEEVFGESLDILFDKFVAKPLGMKNSMFRPTAKNNMVNSNLSASELGTVNDINCRFLGGVSGNAGLFSCIEDMTKYAQMLVNYGHPLIKKETFSDSIKNYTGGKSASRALGYVYVDEKYSQTGNLFSVGSIGHCGHTGQSVFVDLKTGLYVIVLSDATIATTKKYGKEKYDIVIKMREDIHNSIFKDIERM